MLCSFVSSIDVMVMLTKMMMIILMPMMCAALPCTGQYAVAAILYMVVVLMRLQQHMAAMWLACSQLLRPARLMSAKHNEAMQ